MKSFFCGSKSICSSLLGALVLSLAGAAQASSNLPESSVEEDTSYPEQRFQTSMNQVITGINNVSESIYGAPAASLIGKDNEVIADPIQANVPLRFAQSGKALIEAKDRSKTLRYIEVEEDTATGGWGTYEDENGILRRVVWDKDRVVKSDEHPLRPLSEQTLPGITYEKEKTLRESLGLTTTIVTRNGRGGIVKRPGDQASQSVAIYDAIKEVQASLPADTARTLQTLGDTTATSLALLNNRMEQLERIFLESKDTSVVARLNALQTRLDQVTKMVLDIAKKALHCQYKTIDNPNYVPVPPQWNEQA